MRWLLISSQHHPTHGGIGTYVTRFIAAANSAGWHVELMTRPSDRLPPASLIHHVRTIDAEAEFESRLAGLRHLERVRPYRYGLWSLAVARRMLEIEPEFDAVEFVDCQAEGYAALCSPRVRRRFAGIPMLIHAHTPMFIEEAINGVDANRFGRALYHRWERAALAAADGVVTTSRLLADRLTMCRALQVIPYPFAVNTTPPKPVEEREQIALIGSVQPRKGVECWARSLNMVLRERPAARAMLVGPDTSTAPGGASMISHVRRIIEPCLQDRLICTGPISHQQTMQVIDESSLIVVPSVFESFSFVAAEALDRGRPVIVSDRVGIAEHLRGLPVVRHDDPDAWAKAQLHALENLQVFQRNMDQNRRELHDCCDPQHHLRMRAEFVQSLDITARDRRESLARNAADGIEELTAFIAEVEHAEAELALVSSEVS